MHMDYILYISLLWLLFELSFVVRDKIQGKGKTEKDKGTRNYNLFAVILSIFLAIFVYQNTNFNFVNPRMDIFIWIGFLFIVIGILLRIWSITTLGKSFRTTIELHENQRVIKEGPYKLIRHPSYAGALIICLGFGIAFQNWLSLLIMVLIPLIAVIHRIKIEEAELINGMGNDYIEYQKKTKRLFPFIW